MAYIVGTFTPNAASGTSLTSAFAIPRDYTNFALQIPSAVNWCATLTVNVRVLCSTSETGTYYAVGYNNNTIATATSGFPLWEAPQAAATNGGIVKMDVLNNMTYAKLQFTNNATAVTGFVLFAEKK